MKLTYLAISINDGNPVIKKINDWVDAALELGIEANSIIISPSGGLKPYLILNKEIIKSRNKILLIRNPTNLGIILLLSTFIARLNNCKIIIDIPTPISILVKEILGGKKRLIFKYLSAFQLIITSSLPFLFSNIILQYSYENWWYKLGCKNRILLIGNGVNINRLKVRQSFPNWPSTKLNLIGVATVAPWHGYDRILYAMSNFNFNKKFSYKINFDIIGDGPESGSLKKIVADLKLESYVTFHGTINDSNYIQSIYEKSHLAVSSLGLYRIGLNTASVLKSREYVAIGIPFIYAGNDVDFLNNSNFRFMVDNSDSIEVLLKLFETLGKTKFPDPIIIRKYAEDNLSIVNKLKFILNK